VVLSGGSVVTLRYGSLCYLSSRHYRHKEVSLQYALLRVQKEQFRLERNCNDVPKVLAGGTASLTNLPRSFVAFSISTVVMMLPRWYFSKEAGGRDSVVVGIAVTTNTCHTSDVVLLQVQLPLY
jgi:hypothetical protein